MRFAVIFHRFGPYHCARLEAAARDLEVVAIEMAAETTEYAWSKVKRSERYRRVTLFPDGESRGRKSQEIVSRTRSALSNARPEVVAIPGWSNPGALAALQWCEITGTPAVLMSESTAGDEARASWREAIKRRLVRAYSAALAGGKPQVDYLVELGMPRERIFTGYDAVDNEYFAQSAKEVRSKQDEVRRGYGLPENYFLASARFIEKKNLFRLLNAYAAYRERLSPVTSHSSPWSLVLLGDGPLRSDLRHLISDLRLDGHVHLPGFKQYEELPVYYGLANVFIHASTSEQWGLVVNEAMAAGLPVLVSQRCGCARDLVQEGRNGFTFDPQDESQMAGLMLQVSSTPAMLAAMGAVSSEIISDWGPNHFARGLDAAARLAIGVGPKRMNAFDRLMLEALLRR